MYVRMCPLCVYIHIIRTVYVDHGTNVTKLSMYVQVIIFYKLLITFSSWLSDPYVQEHFEEHRKELVRKNLLELIRVVKDILAHHQGMKSTAVTRAIRELGETFNSESSEASSTHVYIHFHLSVVLVTHLDGIQWNLSVMDTLGT